MTLQLIKIRYLLFLFFTPLLAHAQSLEIPRPSPKATVIQYIGVTKVEIDYCRPGAHSRHIFGELVPYGNVWRSGANEATAIAFSHTVFIEGDTIPAGKYGLFTIPGRNTWTVILNSEWNQWGAYNYDESKDVARIEVSALPSNFTEMFTISFSKVTTKNCILSLAWENARIDIKVATDTDANTLKEIDSITNVVMENWQTYSSAAQYYFYELENTEKAMKYINVAISLDAPNPTPWMLKSQILASEKKYAEAIKQAEIALKICKEHDFSFELEENKLKIEKWKLLAMN